MKYKMEMEGRFKGRWKDEKGYFHRELPADARISDEPKKEPKPLWGGVTGKKNHKGHKSA
tara:strand:+ start:677 stop:856 length:180 start_codon:yes stop_codon:yes gene_type:complete